MITVIIILIAGVFLIKKIKDGEREKREDLESEIKTLKVNYLEVKTAFDQLVHKHELELLRMEILAKEKFVMEMKDEFLKLNRTSNPNVQQMEREFIPIKKRG